MNKDKKPYKYERYSYCFLQPTPKYNPIYATITGVANTISQTISNVTVRPMSEPKRIQPPHIVQVIHIARH